MRMPMFTWRAEWRQTSAFSVPHRKINFTIQRISSINKKTIQWMVWVRYFNFLTTMTKRAGATKAQMAPLVNDSQQLQKWGQKFSTTHSMKHKCKMTGREALFFFSLKTHSAADCSSLVHGWSHPYVIAATRLWCRAEQGSLTCLLHHNCPEMTSWTPRISAVGTLWKMYTCYTSTKQFI